MIKTKERVLVLKVLKSATKCKCKTEETSVTPNQMTYQLSLILKF